jgi:hypothetical protein
LEQRVARLATERADVGRAVQTAKVRMAGGFGNVENKIARRRHEVEQLGRVIEQIGEDNERVRAQIEIEKESC